MDNPAAAELVAIITEYHDLRQVYAEALRFRSQPVSDQLPDDSNVAAWRARHDVLAVQKPFLPTFCERRGNTYSEGQELAMEFRSRYAIARRRLVDYYYLRGQARSEKNLLLALRETDVTAASGDGILAALDRHISMLARTLPPKDHLRIRLAIDFPNALLEARGKMTQLQAVKEVHRYLAVYRETVTLDSYKGWEAGRHVPQGNNRTAAEEFIRARLG